MKTRIENKATLTDRTPKFSRAHRKETPCHLTSYVAIETAKPPSDFFTLPERVTLRIYSGKGPTVTAALWCNDGKEIHRSGTGSAGGGGYHKGSAAAGQAIHNAGIDLANDIEGRGESAIRDAVLALALALGCKRPALVETHA